MPDDRNIIDYSTEARRSPWYRRPLTITRILLFVVIIAAVAQLFIPTLRVRPQNDYAKYRCLSNMRMLAQMITLYSHEYHSYPDSLSTLAGNTDKEYWDYFYCSPADFQSATRPTTQGFTEVLDSPDRSAFIYLAPNGSPISGQILLVEKVATHSTPTSANVVFIDGSARSITAAQHQKILQQISAGQTNIVLPP